MTADPSIEELGATVREALDQGMYAYDNMAWVRKFVSANTVLDTLLRRCAQAEEALRETHDQLCGCDRPGHSSACIVPPELGALTDALATSPAGSPEEAEND